MKFIIFYLLIAISSFSHAADIKALNSIETIEILPKGFTKPITYNITIPDNYQIKKDKKYIVLFDLHPRSQPLISGMQDWLSHNGDWPWLQTIIVTPSAYNKEFAELFKKFAENPADETILDIIQHGILKKVDEKYRTNGFKIFSGFRGNGALGLYTLLNRPEMFNAYFIASPTLSNNFANIMSDASKKLDATYQGQKFLYMTIGDHRYETADIKPFKQLEKELKKLPANKLQWFSNSNEKHYFMSLPVITILDGIEALFDDIHHDLTANSEISKQGFDAIVKYYQVLSKEKYGFEVSAEGSLKALAKSYTSSKPDKAIELYTKITKLYPESAYAFSALAKVYADQKQIKQAIHFQSIAVKKSKTMGQWHQNKHQQYLTEYQAMLTKN